MTTANGILDTSAISDILASGSAADKAAMQRNAGISLERFPKPVSLPPVMASPPTFTNGAAGAASTITGGVSRPIATDAAFVKNGPFNAGAFADAPYDIGNARYLTDTDVFELDFNVVYTGCSFQMTVDGQLVSPTAISVTTGTNQIIKVAVNFGSYKMREISVWWPNTARLSNIIVKPNSILTKTKIVSTRHLFVGDSMLTFQHPGSDGLLGYGAIAGLMAGVVDVANYGVVGDGYATGGPLSARQTIINNTPFDVLHMCLGFNDTNSGIAPATSAAAAATSLDSTIATKPQAKILLYSTLIPSNGTGPIAARAAMDAALFALVASRPQVTWIDTSGWFTGTGKITALANNGNRDRTGAGDSIHNAPYGADYMGSMFAREILGSTFL